MKNNRPAGTNVAAHIIVWAVIYLLPILITFISFGSFLPPQAYARYVVIVLGLTAVFYLNYALFVERYLFKSKLLSFIFCNVFTFLLQGILVDIVNVCFFTPPNLPLDVQAILNSAPARIGMSLTMFGSLIIVTFLAISLKAKDRVRIEEERKHILEKEKTEAELKNLKDKLNPHFLFNTLNNIYALVALDSQKAQEAIGSLSNLLRHVLYENESGMVPLEDEMSFTRSYIDLMALRLDPETSTLTVNIDDIPSGNLEVASLLFVTLIENAFKHGVSSREKSTICISIRFPDRKLECDVTNGLFPKSAGDMRGSGIGLENLRQRLELLYGGEYIYDVNISDNEYSAHLVVPLRQAVHEVRQS